MCPPASRLRVVSRLAPVPAFVCVHAQPRARDHPNGLTASATLLADYLKRVSSSSAAASSQSRRAADAEPALPLDSVGALTRQFSNLSDGDAAPTSPKSPASPASPESEKKKAVSVTSLKKLREAKQLEAQREAAAPKRAPPPQVDLYK